MADYAIGDVQGCYTPLMRLLQKIRFDEYQDKLWFVGDLVNRGPASLDVLRFVKALPNPPHITLGNHDLHLLCQIFLPNQPKNPDDTLDDILNAPDKEILGHWLRQQSILHHDEALHIVMTHAGIPPNWPLSDAKTHAKLLENTLQGPDYLDFLSNMYGNTPNHLSANLSKIDHLRMICNAFTRMRFCNAKGHLELTVKHEPLAPPAGYDPWYTLERCEPLEVDLVFGHWAALKGDSPTPRIHAIDTGCVWGGSLTALRLQDKKRFSVPGL